MYHHVKKLMFTVRVDEPDPRFGNMLLEQFGGANGELAAAMQYSIQGLNCEDPEPKDLLMDIGTEEPVCVRKSSRGNQGSGRALEGGLRAAWLRARPSHAREWLG